MAKITVQNTQITVIKQNEDDYISLTDMLKAKDGEFFFSNWLRNRNTIEFLGIWERLINPNFNCAEFDIIKSQAGLNRFRLSAKEWTEKTNAIGINELICLSNMENINAVLINDGVPQGERLVKLNQIAIQQMQVLEGNEDRKLLK
jgi:hypothetical protein